MDQGAYKVLESATLRTLHAHNFSRCSTQASLVLTDLLSRYLSLLSNTCAKYAHHAGRTGLAPWDALTALEELGVGLEELREYYTTEGHEMSRYSIRSAHLGEFKIQLTEGLRQSSDDTILLHYARLADAGMADESEDEYYSGEGENLHTQEGMDVDVPTLDTALSLRKDGQTVRPLSAPLPLSPVSNPASPARKRQRTDNWRPPSHIPDFLPPFPSTDVTVSPPHSPSISNLQLPPPSFDAIKIDAPPSTIQHSQPVTSSSVSASDYLTQVPYSQSTLSNIPEWHLPQTLQAPPLPLPSKVPHLPTPPTEPALIAAYHHILTHPSPITSPSNPARHRVAMALLFQMQTSSRWDPPDTLFSSVVPCPPRVAPIGPTHPIPIGTTPPTPLDAKAAKAEDKDKEPKLPISQPRPVSSTERLSHLISQQPSRIPDLARHVLPPTILTRTSRLSHPPVLMRGNQKLTYGPGIPAPWNTSAPPAVLSTAGGKGKEEGNLPNGKGEAPPQPVLPDARLYATWEAEMKNYRIPLVAQPRNRGRVGSVQSSGVTLSLSRGRGGKVS